MKDNTFTRAEVVAMLTLAVSKIEERRGEIMRVAHSDSESVNLDLETKWLKDDVVESFAPALYGRPSFLG